MNLRGNVGTNLRLYGLIFSLSLYLVSKELAALPIGFGTTPGDLSYDELKSKNFYLYHDARTPKEAQLMLNSLDAARPVLEKWFAVERSSPLPVIMSATTDNASFANFITDVVEVQTMGQGTRDLVWHEYVHSTMYRHFDNWLGPAGSILHLMWMPSWWVEGLAEALSVSIGSDEAASMERYQALSGKWPSFARMHSLYTNADFSYRGYATSGAFVSYILRQLPKDQLPEFLNMYFHKSMPWYWPYSILPFKHSMPLDNVLDKYFGKTGEELYEDYKKAATAHWQSVTPNELLTSKQKALQDFGLTGTIVIHGANAFKAKTDEGVPYWGKVQFDAAGWGEKSVNERPLPAKMQNLSVSFSDQLQVFAFPIVAARGPKGFQLEAATGESERRSVYARRSGFVTNIIATKDHIVWRELQEESSRICFGPRKNAEAGEPVAKNSVQCFMQTKQPKLMHVVGQHYHQDISKKASYIADTIWVEIAEQTLLGNRFQLFRWREGMGAGNFERVVSESTGDVIQVAQAGSELYTLTAESNKRTIRKISANGACIAQTELADFVVNLYGYDSGDLLLGIQAGDDIALLKTSPAKLKWTDCTSPSAHTSPILVALNSGQQTPDLATAMARASLWQKPTSETVRSQNTAIAQAKPGDQDIVYPETRIDQKSTPAKWRARPVLAVPWIGGDSGGTQLGVLSVPLMDHMQNEDVRLYLAYGPESRFPHSEISLHSSRFWPDLQLDAFRYQTWNGTYIDRADDNIEKNAFVDERGARFTAGTFIHSLGLATEVGMKSSVIRHYVGPTRGGVLNEPFVGLSHNFRYGPYVWSKAIIARAAPLFMNPTYEYNTIAVSTGLSRRLPFLDSVLSLDLDGSRTRGTAPRELQEYYRPLKIYVPGSRTGLNNLSFPLIGCCGLFNAHYGSNQGRARASYLFPVISHVDKLIRLFYWDSLYASADFNYGGAWDGEYFAEDADLIASHNYNLTAHFDVKGVNFTAGGGVGQVFGSGLQSYLTFSFDALF